MRVADGETLKPCEVQPRAIRRVGPPSGTVRPQREYTRRTEYAPTEPINLPRSRTPGEWD